MKFTKIMPQKFGAICIWSHHLFTLLLLFLYKGRYTIIIIVILIRLEKCGETTQKTISKYVTAFAKTDHIPHFKMHVVQRSIFPQHSWSVAGLLYQFVCQLPLKKVAVW